MAIPTMMPAPASVFKSLLFKHVYFLHLDISYDIS
jgi:hypothetical protein